MNRPESSAGALVFCECGQGNSVPWESSMAAPAPALPPVGTPPLPPPLRPVPVGEEQIPIALPVLPEDRRAGRVNALQDEPAPRDPHSCFNHQERAGPEKCGDCGESFCDDCLVKFKGAALCGPCKNFRLRQTGQASTVSGKAVVGLVMALCAAPMVMCLVPLGGNAVSMAFCALAVIGQMAAAVLAAIALRETDRNPRLSGRSLAITTMLTAGLGTMMAACLMLFGLR